MPAVTMETMSPERAVEYRSQFNLEAARVEQVSGTAFAEVSRIAAAVLPQSVEKVVGDVYEQLSGVEGAAANLGAMHTLTRGFEETPEGVHVDGFATARDLRFFREQANAIFTDEHVALDEKKQEKDIQLEALRVKLKAEIESIKAKIVALQKEILAKQAEIALREVKKTEMAVKKDSATIDTGKEVEAVTLHDAAIAKLQGEIQQLGVAVTAAEKQLETKVGDLDGVGKGRDALVSIAAQVSQFNRVQSQQQMGEMRLYM